LAWWAGPTRRQGAALIKYLGSKRTLVPLILDAVRAAAPGRGTVIDLFSGTSRVGHALKRAGYRVLSVDHNAYAHALATCYVQADAEDVLADARKLVDEFNALARGGGEPGYFTEIFCERSRFFQPKNGARIDAIREAIARKGLEPELEAVVLVALMEAADRVDSTTGLQMAYLKQWAPRAYKDLELRVPEVLPRAGGSGGNGGGGGKGRAFCADAVEMAGRLEAEVAYIDPPYNQHSYLGNYHVWETLVRWDGPAHYGTACKRMDCRERPSAFNSRVRCKDAMRRVIESVRARTLVVSLSDEGFISPSEMEEMLSARGRVRVIGREYPRYVGAKIGIYSPGGLRVGEVGKLRNREHLFIGGAGAGEPLPALASA
jgi:adenine-specific DNA-methyltransferase